jgi:glutathione S-transferase
MIDFEKLVELNGLVQLPYLLH